MAHGHADPEPRLRGPRPWIGPNPAQGMLPASSTATPAATANRIVATQSSGVSGAESRLGIRNHEVGECQGVSAPGERAAVQGSVPDEFRECADRVGACTVGAADAQRFVEHAMPAFFEGLKSVASRFLLR